jgi:hypothetical protein
MAQLIVQAGSDADTEVDIEPLQPCVSSSGNDQNQDVLPYLLSPTHLLLLSTAINLRGTGIKKQQ